MQVVKQAAASQVRHCLGAENQVESPDGEIARGVAYEEFYDHQ